MMLPRYFKQLWVRALQRGTAYAGRSKRFEALYKVADPWNMLSEREQFRFIETNRIIESEVGHVDTLLEVGCGEGHQSQFLQRVCRSLSGFDVSANAVKRASARCPRARFSVADIQSYPEDERFDLVVACEILYYVPDVRAAVQRMSKLGSACLVTYLQAGPCQLDPFLTDIEGLQRRTVEFGDTSWQVVWWKSAEAGAGGS